MALYFAATQFPIYLLPRLIETLIGRNTGKAKP
jgi:BASS family bile acid:Na+ symporter